MEKDRVLQGLRSAYDHYKSRIEAGDRLESAIWDTGVFIHTTLAKELEPADFQAVSSAYWELLWRRRQTVLPHVYRAAPIGNSQD